MPVGMMKTMGIVIAGAKGNDETGEAMSADRGTRSAFERSRRVFSANE